MISCIVMMLNKIAGSDFTQVKGVSDAGSSVNEMNDLLEDFKKMKKSITQKIRRNNEIIKNTRAEIRGLESKKDNFNSLVFVIDAFGRVLSDVIEMQNNGENNIGLLNDYDITTFVLTLLPEYRFIKDEMDLTVILNRYNQTKNETLNEIREMLREIQQKKHDNKLKIQQKESKVRVLMKARRKIVSDIDKFKIEIIKMKNK
ncbi:hypothetical protein ECANGB1_786 [Enterospora canceri]|uniref:Uncharacterized protein n=1 Tax=Enterospora canceri TaxID=1081671 RepID=A0A1Y1S7G8_9MICR|nr:hypothetical protein ECANGB1_786 [Enterospora canceri]